MQADASQGYIIRYLVVRGKISLFLKNWPGLFGTTTDTSKYLWVKLLFYSGNDLDKYIN